VSSNIDCAYETMREADLDEVLHIERTVFKHPWSKDFFRLIMSDANNYVITLKRDDAVIGYGGYHFLSRQTDFTLTRKKYERVVHLINIAIRPDQQCRGFGTYLLSTLIDHARIRNGNYCYLEVRPSNSRAITFYRKSGFFIIGLIEDYYPLESENALVMGKELTRLVNHRRG
jgi:ribosomal-protein-alanine N-acetyltransferase